MLDSGPADSRTATARLQIRTTTLSLRLRTAGPEDRTAIAVARLAFRVKRRRAEERAARKAIPVIVARMLGRGQRSSVPAACRQLGISATRLKNRYPGLAAIALQNCRRARIVSIRQRRRRLKAQLRQIVRNLQAHGDQPTYTRVVALLGFHFAGDKHIIAYFRKVRGFAT